jgi:S-adenosylmethionine:tRNA-ribosyltransferase-isomerase (queuine synthetase)
MSLLTKDYDYHLPPELIASRPLPDRAASRMLVIDRKDGSITAASRISRITSNPATYSSSTTPA